MTASQIIASRSIRSEFTSLATAISYRERSPEYAKLSIIMGDNGRFWLLTNRLASILINSGYELAS